MPRTRNVSRREWDAANAGHDSKSTKENNEYGSEKENGSRAAARSTRSRAAAAAAGRTVLGTVAAPTRNAAASSSSKLKTKGKGKPPGKPTVTKTEKLPLQDITSRFLPAQESENRGFAQPTGFGPPENLLLSPGVAGPSTFLSTAGLGEEPALERTTASKRVYPSSLPPSSPPSLSSNAQPQLPVLSRSPTPIANPLSRRLFGEQREAPVICDSWQEFDFAVPDSDANHSRPRPTPRNSDPFGFFALERKLEAEREEEQTVGGIVLVKETSPALEYTDDPALEGESEVSLHLPPVPPTPHKRSVIPRRDSYISGEEHVFSSRAGSSCPSSPSPSKPQSTKRKAADFDAIHDEPASTPHVRKQPRRVKKAKIEVKVTVEEEEKEKKAKPMPRRSLRGKKVVEEEEVPEPQPGTSRKSRSTKSTTTVKPTRSRVKKETTITVTKSKKTAAILPEDDSDAEEKREQERQARLAYFRELDEYKVETENVYVI